MKEDYLKVYLKIDEKKSFTKKKRKVKKNSHELNIKNYS